MDKIKVNNLRPTLNGDFVTAQLDNNPLRTMKIRSKYHAIFREGMVNYLRANDNFFCYFPHEMS